MNKTYTHKGHTITFRESWGDFETTINGRHVTSTSLKGIQKQIEKHALAEFIPFDVLILKCEGANNRWSVVLHKVVAYREEKSYRSRDINRFLVTDCDEKISLTRSYYNRQRVFSVSEKAQLEKLCAERNVQESIEDKAKTALKKIAEKLESISFDLTTVDPKSDK